MASPVHPSPSQFGRELGKYENGKWYCCCNLEAAFRMVKKDGPNKGRHFHRCPNWGAQCSFFLYEDDAKVRQQQASQQNSPVNTPGARGQESAFNSPGAMNQNSAFARNPNSGFNGPGAINQNSPLAGSPNSVPNTRAQVKRNSLLQAIRNRRARCDSPDSEGASTVTEGPIYSPTSGGFHIPASHRSFLRTPNLPEPDWSSDEDEDNSGTADGRHQPRLSRYADPPTPTPKRKQLEAEGTDAGADAGGPAGDTQFSEIDPDVEEELVDMAGEIANQGRPAAPAQPPPRPSQGSGLPATPSGRATRAGLGGLQTPASRNNVTNPASGSNELNPASGNSFTSLASGTSAVETSEPGSKRRKTTQGFATSTPTASRSSQGDAEMTTAAMNILRVGERVSASLRETMREMLNEANRQSNRRIQTAEAQLKFALDAVEEKKAEISRLVRENAMQRMEISGLKDQVQASEMTSGIVAALYRNDQNDDDIDN